MYIGDKKLEDWGIVTDVEIGEAPIREKSYTVPGRMGKVDATDALTGYPIYDNRSLSIKMFIKAKTPEEYQSTIDDIQAYCHGKVRRVTFLHDNDHYYEGRLKVSPDKNNKTYGNITITGSMYPYALKKEITQIDVSSTTAAAREAILQNEGMPTKIIVETNTDIAVTRITKGIERKVYSAGKHIINTPLLIEDETVIVEGAVTATISYQEGKL